MEQKSDPLQLQLEAIKQSQKENEEKIPKGEKMLKQYRQPKPKHQLPNSLKQLQIVTYDPEVHDLKAVVCDILKIKKEEIETYEPDQNVFNYSYSKYLREIVGKSEVTQQIYTKFIKEVIGPYIYNGLLKDNIVTKDQKEDFELYYQFPPTLRVHPSTTPPRPLGRVHRDAEFGHQPGEVNFWLAITKAGGGASLWCESEPLKGDFKPFELEYGQVQSFWGCEVNHVSGVNDTGNIRISMDFRVAPKQTFDKDWKLPSTFYSHEWRKMHIDLEE